MNEKVLQAVIKLKDEISKPLKSVNESLKSTKKATEEVTKAQWKNSDATIDAEKVMKDYEKQQNKLAEATKKHKESVKEASATLRNFGGSVLGIVGGGLAMATKKAVEFEYAMAEVGAISKASKEDMAKLTEEAKRLGASTKFTASEAAAGMNKFAMTGYEVDQIMAATSGTLALATAGNTDLALTCDIVSDAMTGLKLSAEETGEFVDIMTATITGSNTDIAMLGETLKYVAPVAGTLGVEFEDLALAAGLMGNASVKASQAGTSLKSGLTRLIKPVGEGKKAMDKYNISIVKNKKGQLDMAGTIQVLKNKLGSLEPVQKASAIASIFGQESMAGWAAVIDSSDADFNKLTDSIANSAGEAERISEIYRNTTKGALDNLGSAFEGVAINIGSAFIPMLNQAADFLGQLATAFNELDPALQQNVAQFMLIVAGVGGVLLIVGLLSPIITGITLFFQALSVVVGIVAGAFAFLCTPVGLAIAAVLALTAGCLWLRDNGIKSFEDLKNKVKESVDKMIEWWNNFVAIITSPIKAVVNISKNIKETVTSGGTKKKNAFGAKRVTRNDELHRLHEGERILTKQQSSQMDKGLGNSNITFNMNGTVIREEADIDKLASAMVRKIKEAKLGYTSVGGMA